MADHSSFTVPLCVTIRPCREGDLPGLEWFGLFTHHRAIFHETFASQARGETIMLVADVNGFPAGQSWIDLKRIDTESIGYLWAVRVFPFLQGHGIGTRLIHAAEDILRARKAATAEINVERDNAGAKRLYERLGYRVVGAAREDYEYDTPDGEHVRVPLETWVLHKDLNRDEEETR